jgi:ATP-dependent Clp protease adapter protein ClpS
LNSIDVDFPDTETLVQTQVEVQLPSRVLLYNDDVHTYDEVIFQLMKATGCPLFEAESMVLEVDLRGQAYVFEGEMLRCLNVSSILEEIELLTEVEFT